MATLLLRLRGPMQSWATSGTFENRESGTAPSKSGVLGLLSAALGLDRQDRQMFETLAGLRMGVRHDLPGIPFVDFQTICAGPGAAMIQADGLPADRGGLVTRRGYLGDAAFLVGLESPDQALLEDLDAALRNPVWFLYLGRMGCVATDPVALPERAVQDLGLREALMDHPWLVNFGQRPTRVRLSIETSDVNGDMLMDQPLSTPAARKFRARYVHSEWITLPDPPKAMPSEDAPMEDFDVFA